MKKDVKRVTIYVLINILLFVIATLLIIGIFVYYIKTNDISQSEIMSFSDNSNELLDVQTDIGVTKTNQAAEKQVTVPIMVEYSSNNIDENTNKLNYYYQQLDENAKRIYNTLVANLDNMKSGTYKVNLPNEVSGVMEQENGYNILNQEFQSVCDALVLDKVDTYFLDISKMNLTIKTLTYGTKVSYTLSIEPNETGSYLDESFSNEQIVDMSLTQLSNVRDEIIGSLSGSDYNKVREIHNWLVDNVSYGTEVSGSAAYTAYGALIHKSAVCEGYAEAFKYILDKLEIPSILVTGTARNSEGSVENHEWNYVQLDGKWYGVDVTWDDPIIIGGGTLDKATKYKYFLKSNNVMKLDHSENGKISDKGIEFSYPILENENY